MSIIKRMKIITIVIKKTITKTLYKANAFIKKKHWKQDMPKIKIKKQKKKLA